MNPQIVSLEWVISKLKLSDTPRPIALNQILKYANEVNGLSIYFDGKIRAARSQTEPEELLDPPLHPGGEPVHLGRALFYADAEAVSGRKRLLGISFLASTSGYTLITSKFLFEDNLYHCCDDLGMWVENISIRTDEVYCMSQEFNDFCTLLKRQERINLREVGKDPGLTKALALLSREKADSSPKFRSGKKVNASAIKRHIIDLAEKYDVSDSHLKKIDDIISNALSDLDIKDVSNNP